MNQLSYDSRFSQHRYSPVKYLQGCAAIGRKNSPFVTGHINQHPPLYQVDFIFLERRLAQRRLTVMPRPKSRKDRRHGYGLRKSDGPTLS